MAPLGIQDPTVLQVTTAAGISNAVVMPVGWSTGILTASFPDVPPFGRDRKGVVRNEDGSLNDADHPAAVGSAVMLYVTGNAASTFVWWFSPGSGLIPITPRVTTSTMPGFIPAVAQITTTVPAFSLNQDRAQSLTVALQPFAYGPGQGHPPLVLPSPADEIFVYVK